MKLLISLLVIFPFLGYTQISVKPRLGFAGESETVERKINARERGSIIWSEDFSAGMNSSNGQWTVVGPDSLIWKHSFFGTSGEWSMNTPQPLFSTVGNGFMLLDLDSANFPNSPNYLQYSAELISPIIDLSQDSSVNISFEHFHRHCCSNPNITLEVSADSGQTWTSIDVKFSTSASISPPNPEYEDINLSSLIGGAPFAQIKFKWDASSHYFWAIDDIELYPSPDHELGIVSYNYLSALGVVNAIEYSLIDQLFGHQVYHKSTIQNLGSSTEQFKLIYEFLENGTIKYSDTSDIHTLGPGQTIIDSTLHFDIDSMSPANYQIEVKLEYDDVLLDAVPSNNSVSKWFEIVSNFAPMDMIISRSRLEFAGTGIDFNLPSYEIISLVKNHSDYPLENEFIIEAAFHSSSTLESQYSPVVYLLDQATGAFIDFYTDTVNTYSINNGSISVDSNIVWNSINVCFPSSTVIQPNEIFGIGINSLDGGTVLAESNSYSPLYTNFIYDSQTASWYQTPKTPALRSIMNIKCFSTSEYVEEKPFLFPNPASDIMKVEFKNYGFDINIFVLETSGKLILYKVLGSNYGESYIDIAIDSLPNGVYYVQVDNGKRILTEKLVISK